MRLLQPAAFLSLLLLGNLLQAEEPLKIYGSAPRAEVSRYAKLNLSPAQLAAAQELEAAQYRFVTWTHFEFPALIRNLDAEIVVVREQVASFQRRYAEFSRFAVWSGGGDPLFETREDVRLALVAAQQRLKLLEAERGDVLQHQAIEYRQREMEVERARLNLRLAR